MSMRGIEIQLIGEEMSGPKWINIEGILREENRIKMRAFRTGT
jgi:hypothetical protein